MRMPLLSLALCAMLATGCATPPPPPVETDAPAVQLDASCPTEPGALMLATTPDVARQGSALLIRPSLYRGPMGPLPMPAACLTDVTVSPASAAQLTPGRDQIVLAPDAPPGTVVTLSARYRDDVDAHEIVVAGRDQVVLTGTWRQDSVKCEQGRAPGQPVRELKVGDDGRFGVTYQPFETYVDWWGDLTFDPATGSLALSRTGDNANPPLLDLQGAARLESERRLILSDVYLGDQGEAAVQPQFNDKGEMLTDGEGRPLIVQPRCTYVFVR